MTNKARLQILISPALKQQVEEAAEVRGTSVTSVVDDSLRNWLVQNEESLAKDRMILARLATE